MKQRNRLLGLALMVGIALWSPAILLALEHGGKEHGGQEHGGAAVEEESQGEGAGAAATLNEAAKVLREAGRTDLAAKLEAMAAAEE